MTVTPMTAGSSSAAWRHRVVGALLALCLTVCGWVAGQAFPDHVPVVSPAFEWLTCPSRTPPSSSDAASLAAFAERQRYRELLPAFLARLPDTPDDVLLMPVVGVRVSQVADTYAAARDGGRSHEGQDVFAPRGTPVVAATSGLVYEMSERFRGGRSVMVLGPGQRRYFYSHLDGYAATLREGMWVEAGDVLGFVGNDGNAATTPPHLHFGAYAFDAARCRFVAYDPLPFLVDALP